MLFQRKTHEQRRAEERQRFMDEAARKILPHLLGLPYEVFSGMPMTIADHSWDNLINGNHARAARCAYHFAEALWQERLRRMQPKNPEA